MEKQDKKQLMIRRATIDDLNDIMSIFAKAKIFMVEHGNPNQWVGGYPSVEVITNDIQLKNCYVLEYDNKVSAVFCFIIGPDPTYRTIDGRWLNDLPYGTIHRIASDGTVKGVADTCLSWCRKMIDNIRVDTHEDNKVMQHWAESRGFRYCGIIHLANGAPRLAYHLYD